MSNAHIAKELQVLVREAEADLENVHPQTVLERVLRQVEEAARALEAGS